MSCTKINQKCGTPTYAPCVIYEKTVPTYSLLSAESCINIEQTTEDTYKEITDLREQTELSALGSNCLTYVKDAENRVVVKNVLLKYEEEICTLKQQITNINQTSICDRDISSCIDTTGLTDPCGDPINTFGQIIQFLTDKHKTP